MRYKHFIYGTVSALALFLLFNIAVWKLATEDLLTGKAGDLSRIGYVSEAAELKSASVDLPKRHIEGTDFSGGNIDVLVIGDSFSNGGGRDRNPFYQDYIATVNGYDVLNIQPYKNHTPLTTIYILMNSGWLDKYKPRFVLVESVGRYSVLNLGGTIGVNKTDFIGNIERFYREAKYENEFEPGDIAFINTGNIKYFFYRLLYLFSDHAYYSQVYKKKLNTPLFSKGDGRTLLFYYEDLKAISFMREEYIRRMNYNLNALASRLRQMGIALVFLPAVDKYDLYSDYIADNPYPRSVFFERLRALEKGYFMIDTKGILAEELKRGEKDIFAPDDSHWTWKASKKIFESFSFAKALEEMRGGGADDIR